LSFSPSRSGYSTANIGWADGHTPDASVDARFWPCGCEGFCGNFALVFYSLKMPFLLAVALITTRILTNRIGHFYSLFSSALLIRARIGLAGYLTKGVDEICSVYISNCCRIRYIIHGGNSHQLFCEISGLTSCGSAPLKESLPTVREFVESMTTQEGTGRPVFNDMLRLVERGEANALLAWHPIVDPKLGCQWTHHLPRDRQTDDLKFQCSGLRTSRKTSSFWT